MNLNKAQKEVYANKVAKGFNITDVPLEFCYIQEETSEAFRAYIMGSESVGEELADITIFILGLAEILGISLENEVVRKMKINKKRHYARVDGVLQKVE